MRSIGFVLIGIGVLVMYLGWNGKLGAAVAALTTGQLPSAKPAPGPQSTDKPVGKPKSNGDHQVMTPHGPMWVDKNGWPTSWRGSGN